MPLCFFDGVFAAGPVFLKDFFRRDGGIALSLPCKRNTGTIVDSDAVGVRAIAICCNNGLAERHLLGRDHQREAGSADLRHHARPDLSGSQTGSQQISDGISADLT